MSVDGETSPVSYRLQVNRLPRSGATVTIEADEESRAALARSHGLLSVDNFSAELNVRPWKGDGVRVTGHVGADITQECTVTLEPLSVRIDEEVSAIFVPETSRLARAEEEGGEILLEAEGEDLPEPFTGDSLDLGALAEEFFALGIDPYPRKPGAALEVSESGKGGETGENPLREGLRKLRENR